MYAINNETMKILWFLNLNQSLDLNPSNLFYGNQIVTEQEKIFLTTNRHTYTLELLSGLIIDKKKLLV